MTTLHAATANSVGLNLSLMCREPVFTSRSAQETQRLMRQVLVEHELDWPRGGVDTAFYRGQVASCELYALRYGGPVEIRPQPFEDFVLVQMPLRGSATLESDGMSYGVSPGEVAILSPREQARVVWEEGCEQLILKLPRALLDASQNALGDDLPAGFTLAPVSRLQRPLAMRWFRLVSELLEHLPEVGERDTFALVAAPGAKPAAVSAQPLWRCATRLAVATTAHAPAAKNRRVYARAPCPGHYPG